MNWLDIIIIVLIVIAAIRGFSRGFILELASLVGLVAGIYAAIYFSDFTRELLNRWFHWNGKYMSVISFLVTFAVVSGIVFLIGMLLEKMIDIAALGLLNKLAGAMFGGLQAVVMVSVVLYAINIFDHNKRVISDKAKANSALYEPIASVVPTLLPFIDFDKLKLKLDSPKVEEQNSGGVY